jgi:uncharacterized membrane protein
MAGGSGRARARHRDPAGRRAALGSGAAFAGVVGAVAAGGSWSVDALAAWDAAALTFLALVWRAVAPQDGVATARLAQGEEGSPRASEAALLGAAAASLIAIGFTLGEAGRADHGGRVALTLFAVGSVALSWACVHTVYTLRYARLYFTPPRGGLGFAGDDPPQYVDFAYVAFTIGMCFQVSDTDIAKKTLRRAAIHHALLSYLFGAVILAIAVSTVASLLGS